MEVKRRGRPGKYPDYLLANFKHSSRKFEASHRMRLKETIKAFDRLMRGSAWSPAYEELKYARNALKVASELVRPGKWKVV